MEILEVSHWQCNIFYIYDFLQITFLSDKEFLTLEISTNSEHLFDLLHGPKVINYI